MSNEERSGELTDHDLEILEAEAQREDETGAVLRTFLEVREG